MNTFSSRPSLLRAAALTVTALVLGGCLKERLAWSPDGQRAAIITADGLYVTEANGRISPLLAPGAYRAAWLPDSQRIVLARKKEAKTFADVSMALGPDRTKTLTLKAEALGKKLQEMPRTAELEKRLNEELSEDIWGVLAYLREQPHHLKTLREKFGAEWKKDDENKPVELNEIIVARVSGDRLEFGPALWIGLPEVQSLRPAPGGQAVAFAMKTELSPHPDTGICLLVASADASAPAVTVATQSTTNPDWTPDGRTLVFFKAAGSTSTGDDLRLGALIQREVLGANGRVKLAAESIDLAGLIFHQQNRVRCLRDGRVLFNASPVTLPTTGNNDNDREQLFVLDRAPEATIRPLIPPAQLEQLPKTLSFFEASPDENQILFSGDNAEAWLLTLATGTVERVAARLQSGKERGEGENYPAAVWRQSGEITILRRAASASGQAGPAPLELVLRRGTTDTVISRDWAPSILRRLIE